MDITNVLNDEENQNKDNNKKINFDYEPGKSTTPIPIDVEFDSKLHSVFQDPLPEALPGKSQEVPGFFETVKSKFKEQEEFFQAAEYRNRKIDDRSPLDDYVDPNWSQFDDKSALIGVDPKNTGYILDATGPKDQRRRYNYVMDKQEHDERMSRGSIIAQFLGGGLGFGLSPSSLIPISRAVKYAKVSQSFLQNLPKMVAGVGVASASHEALLETTKVGGNLQDWAINTMLDTVMGTAFMGAHLGFVHASDAGKLFNARPILKMMNDGIDTRPVINEKGIITGFKAVATDGSVGAAQVDMAQVYLDAALSKNSLHAIPYIGEKVGSTLGDAASYLGGVINPIIRMTSSKFSTLRGLGNNVYEHAFETEGIAQGREIQTPFETMMSAIRGSNVNLKTQYDGFYLNRNGITYDPKKPFDRTKANLQGTIREYFKDGGKTKVEFGREVQYALVTEDPSQEAAVNEATAFLRKMMDPLYLEHLKLYGISDKILKPRTARGYLSRVFHTARMEVNEQEWMDTVSAELANDDLIIHNLLHPINNMKEQIKIVQEGHEKLIRKKSTSSEKIKSSLENLEDLKRRQTALQNDLQNHLRENEDLHRHIDDIHAVSATEAEQIKTLLKPLQKIEKDLDVQKEVVRKTKEEQAKNKQSSLNAKTKETASKSAKLTDMGANDVKIEETKLKELQDKYDTEYESLQERMHNKQIPEELFTRIPDSNRYKLKDTNNRLKMRDVYESDFARQTAAKSYYDSILNQTPEDNIRNIMNKGTGMEKENPLTKRTLMLSDRFLYDNNWLHPDPAINVMNYRNVLGRKNAIKIVLDRLTVNGTFEELIKRFGDEHTQMKADLSKPLNALQEKISKLTLKENKTEAELTKLSELEARLVKTKDKYDNKVRKLGKSFGNNKEDLELMIGKMQGKSRYSKKSREYARLANLWAVATKLGFLPFTMTTDLMATVFKFGLWPSIRDGLFPMLKNLGGMANTKEGAAIRENAAHAHLAYSHVNMAYSDKNWTGTSQTYEAVQGKLATGMETLAHYSGNISLANYVENFNQRLTAQIIQSKIIKAMLDFKEGKLKDSDLKSLLRYGINPKNYADEFIEGWKGAGSDGNGFGGYQSRYWEWDDKESANLMSQAIHRATRDTVIRRGMFDAPFAMDNPLINSIFLFKGYTMASMTRYLAPLMQRPDAQKLIGTMLMMAAGATQNPLRRIVNGKDPVEEENHMFRNAMRDGGVFSSLTDAYEEVDFLTHGLLQETVTNERYRGRSEMGVMNGPIGGGISDLSRIISMVGTGEFNKTDLRRVVRNVPILSTWQLRAGIDKWIEHRGLPKNRSSAKKAAH